MTLAAPQVTVEGASLTLSSGATVTVDTATIAEDRMEGEGVGVVDGFLTIQADSTEVSLDATQGRFDGNVRAVRGDLSFRADRVEVEFGPNGEVIRASAHGRVKAMQGERTAEGEAATFENDRLTLSGRPIVRQGESEMVGEKIIFEVGRKTIECIQCTLKVKGSIRP